MYTYSQQLFTYLEYIQLTFVAYDNFLGQRLYIYIYIMESTDKKKSSHDENNQFRQNKIVFVHGFTLYITSRNVIHTGSNYGKLFLSCVICKLGE